MMINKEFQSPNPELQELITDPQELFSDIFEQLKINEINVSEFELDHIGYRASSTAEYETLCKSLSTNGHALLFSEKIVRGRRIAVFVLTSTIQFENRTVECLEIIEPKRDDIRTFPHQLEHAEFVITDMSLDEFVEKYPHVKFDTIDISRERNPELRLELPSRRTVVFHTIALAVFVSK